MNVTFTGLSEETAMTLATSSTNQSPTNMGGGLIEAILPIIV